MENSIEVSFETLLSDWESLPKSEWKRTFQDIQGTGHKELVCSRLFDFFLNPEEDHGLGNLMWRALVKSIKEPEHAAAPVNLAMDHSKKTERGNLIDHLLITDTLVIGIEHKIHAWLYNDLPDYRNWTEHVAVLRQAENEMENAPKVRCLVMAPRKLRDAHSLAVMADAEFDMLTYSTLAKTCRDEFGRITGREAKPGSPEWRFQLLFDDFLTNLENLSHQSMTSEASQFLFTNATRIESLQEDYRVFQRQLVDELDSILESEFREHIARTYIWENSTLCIELNHADGLGVNLGWGRDGFAPLIHTKDFSPLDEGLRAQLKTGLPSAATVEDCSEGKSLVANYEGISTFDELTEAARNLMKEIVTVVSPIKSKANPV